MTECIFVGGQLAGRMAKVPEELQYLTYQPDGSCNETYVRHGVTYMGFTMAVFAPNHTSAEKIHEMWLTMNTPVTHTNLVFIHRAGDISAQCFLPKGSPTVCPPENSSPTSSPPSARCGPCSEITSAPETPLPYELL